MRIKRAKKYKKYINFFKVVYKFQSPHKILVDGNFLHQALRQTFSFKDQLSKLFGGGIVIVTTVCIAKEIEALALQVPALKDTAEYVKKLLKEKCGHTTAVEADECMKSLVNRRNDAKYFVAT